MTMVLALAWLLAAPLAQHAPAQEVADDGRVLYTELDPETENGDIWVVRADGSGATNLTNTPAVSEGGPAWSPDGERIAFGRSLPVSGEPGSWQADLFIMDADGGDEVRLTDSELRDESGPSWSPTGDRIAYEVVLPDFNREIFIMRVADPASAYNVTDSPYDESDPSWSPVDDRILFSAVRDPATTPAVDHDWEIVTVRADGSGEVNLTAQQEGQYSDWAPRWSPDASMVVYMSQHDTPCCGDWDVWAVNSDGSGASNLIGEDGDSDLDPGDWFPGWSPDGEAVTFSSNRDTGWRFATYTMPAPDSLPLAAEDENAGAALASTLFTRAAYADASDAQRFDAVPTSDTAQRVEWWARPRCTIRGSAGDDDLLGTAGDDVICGLGGRDRIWGGAGRDIIRSGRGADTVFGGRGTDLMYGGFGIDRLVGEIGHDLVHGGDAEDLVDLRDGGVRNDIGIGGAGNDRCPSDSGDDVTRCD